MGTVIRIVANQIMGIPEYQWIFNGLYGEDQGCIIQITDSYARDEITALEVIESAYDANNYPEYDAQVWDEGSRWYTFYSGQV